MTAHRRERQGAILRLIRERQISTQAELAAALREAGFEAVQTTVSRDISDLGLVKVRAANGRLVYAPAGTRRHRPAARPRAAFRRWALAIDANDNLVVVFTPRGFSAALADAIDESQPSTRARDDGGREHDPRRPGRGRVGPGTRATS